jgi:hypothetical protein
MHLLKGEMDDGDMALLTTAVTTKINEAVAVKIFNAELIKSPFSTIVCCDFPNREMGTHFPSMPPFATDWNLALEVRDKMYELSFSRRKFFTDRLQQLVSAEYAEQLPENRILNMTEVFMNMKPHHICIAALETIGDER